LAAALGGTQSGAQTAPPRTHPHLDLFLQTLRSRNSAAGGPAPSISQAKLEQVLRILPPVSVGHGTGPALSGGSPGGAAPVPDPSIYGFCYESCRSDRAVASCGKPGPGETHPPDHLCDPIEDTATLRAIIGPPLGTGASPFVDDNKGPDGAQPAGYTFLGQFIDHDVTRTTTALSALGALDQAAQSDASVRATLAAAGITPDLLRQAIADAAVPGSALGARRQHQQARPRQRLWRPRFRDIDRDQRAMVRAAKRRLHRALRDARDRGAERRRCGGGHRRF
jgi:hypothetical protein